MKRSRRRPHPPQDLAIAADDSTDDTIDAVRPPGGNRYNRMRLPHERDESTHPPGTPNPVTTQGAQDLAEGKTDTDCYDAVGPRYDRKQGES
ncbi:MAG TPA: hypothetical protein VFJ25_00420 [Casimicrobiaceae bacterium]|nr:hypothetical protein [Casimicrobiaceae bacterium]